MNNLRKYGDAPFNVAVIHGGPGAGGEMAPVARELAPQFGVLEPLQAEKTLDGQVVELRIVLEENADLPVSLIDFRIIEIEHCGHKPWIERQAKDKFYEILSEELHAA